MKPSRGNHEIVEDVEHCDRDDGGDVEPDRDVEMTLAALRNSSKQIDGKHNPSEDDCDIDRPFQFGVFLALRGTERKCERRTHDDQLPTPEVQAREKVAEHAGLEKPLRRVIDRKKDAVAREGEDHRVGVEWAKSTKGGPLKAEIEARIGELRGDEHPDEEADDAPHNRRNHEHARYGVVVTEALEHSCSGAVGGISECAGGSGWTAHDEIQVGFSKD